MAALHPGRGIKEATVRQQNAIPKTKEQRNVAHQASPPALNGDSVGQGRMLGCSADHQRLRRERDGVKIVGSAVPDVAPRGQS